VHIYDKDRPENTTAVAIVNARTNGSKGFLTSKKAMENYFHPSLFRSFWEVGDSVIFDMTGNWIESWNELDVPTTISQRMQEIISEGQFQIRDYAKGKIKGRIASNGVALLTREHLAEIRAEEEIQGWVTAINRLSILVTTEGS
jgi:hypothetical protein